MLWLELKCVLRPEKSRDFSVTADAFLKVRPDKEFCAEVKRICGSESMEILANQKQPVASTRHHAQDIVLHEHRILRG